MGDYFYNSSAKKEKEKKWGWLEVLDNFINLSNLVKKGENYWKCQKFLAFSVNEASFFETGLWKKLARGASRQNAIKS